jgi:hypothetical protein
MGAGDDLIVQTNRGIKLYGYESCRPSEWPHYLRVRSVALYRQGRVFTGAWVPNTRRSRKILRALARDSLGNYFAAEAFFDAGEAFFDLGRLRRLRP